MAADVCIETSGLMHPHHQRILHGVRAIRLLICSDYSRCSKVQLVAIQTCGSGSGLFSMTIRNKAAPFHNALIVMQAQEPNLATVLPVTTVKLVELALTLSRHPTITQCAGTKSSPSW